MGKRLTAEQVEQYERDGFLCPISVLSDDAVERCRAAFDAVEALAGGRLLRLDLGHLYFRWAYDLALHPVVLDVVEDILGPDLLIHATLVFCKYPGHDACVPWHQDSVYSGWHQTPSVSAWIALTDSTPESGCMRAIPGSHRHGLQPHIERKTATTMLERGEQVQMRIDDGEGVDLVLRAGQMSLHHNTVIHKSNPNASEARRIGFIVRFISSQLPRSGHPVVRARGAGDLRHLPVMDGPPHDTVEESFVKWDRSSYRVMLEV